MLHRISIEVEIDIMLTILIKTDPNCSRCVKVFTTFVHRIPTYKPVAKFTSCDDETFDSFNCSVDLFYGAN